MRVISRKTLVLFANAHADAREPLFAWYHAEYTKRHKKRGRKGKK